MILSRHSRAEARFPRQHSGAAPVATAGLRGWGYDLRDAAILICACGVLWWLLNTI